MSDAPAYPLRACTSGRPLLRCAHCIASEGCKFCLCWQDVCSNQRPSKGISGPCGCALFLSCAALAPTCACRPAMYGCSATLLPQLLRSASIHANNVDGSIQQLLPLDCSHIESSMLPCIRRAHGSYSSREPKAASALISFVLLDDSCTVVLHLGWSYSCL